MQVPVAVWVHKVTLGPWVLVVPLVHRVRQVPPGPKEVPVRQVNPVVLAILDSEVVKVLRDHVETAEGRDQRETGVSLPCHVF